MRVGTQRLLPVQPPEVQFALLRHLSESLGLSAHLMELTYGPFLLPAQDETVTRYVALEGDWERGIRCFLESQLAKGGTFIDVGAHIGLFSCRMAQLPNTKVFAFEPAPENYRLLQLNSRIQGVAPHMTTFQQAIGDAAGSVRLKVSNTNSGDNRIIEDAAELTQSDLGRAGMVIDSQQQTLDSVMNGITIAGPTVLKVDVQGAELGVLRGASRTLPDVTTLVMEVTLGDTISASDKLSSLFRCLRGHFPLAALLDAQGDGGVVWLPFEELVLRVTDSGFRATPAEVNIVFSKSPTDRDNTIDAEAVNTAS